MRRLALPDASELVSILRTTATTSQRAYTLYSLRVPDLSAGATVMVQAQFEVLHELDAKVMLSTAMIRTPSKRVFIGHEPDWSDAEFVYPGVPATRELLAGVRREVYNASGSVTIDAASAGVAFFSLVAWVATDGAPEGSPFVIERGRGGLAALVFE